MMWGRCMFYRNGRPPAKGGSRGHHGGRPQCGDENPFGLWIGTYRSIILLPLTFGVACLNPPPQKKWALHNFVTLTQCIAPT